MTHYSERYFDNCYANDSSTLIEIDETHYKPFNKSDIYKTFFLSKNLQTLYVFETYSEDQHYSYSENDFNAPDCIDIYEDLSSYIIDIVYSEYTCIDDETTYNNVEIFLDNGDSYEFHDVSDLYDDNKRYTLLNAINNNKKAA
ncbi:hypothetical protein [Fluviispira vulneris]|uniref:hypothetical protein n=1 Tax=Fluviispira vulneris TaxID=2763012 RepID=UPI001645501B|nr:hypothetical protein [Fluviispira vulneris]